MAEEQSDEPTFGPLVDESLKRAAFGGPAIYTDRIVVTENDRVIRIAVMESSVEGEPLFRGAVAIPLRSARDLKGMLEQIIKNVEARDAKR